MKWLNYLFFIISLTFFLVGCKSTEKNHIKKHISPVKIVVLGSSTAAGRGPLSIDSSWVRVMKRHLEEKSEKNVILNLAKGGYTTYHILPDAHLLLEDKPKPDSQRNITKALTYTPDIIVVNLPSNDAAYGYSVKEQMINFEKVSVLCRKNNVELFITTAQPRNFDEKKRKELMALNLTLRKKYGNHIIDFWSGLARDDGTIISSVGSGDGVHLNGKGHKVLADRVLAVIGD